MPKLSYWGGVEQPEVEPMGLSGLAEAAHEPLAYMTPVVGDAMALRDAEESYDQARLAYGEGDYYNAALHGIKGATDQLTTVPVIGDVAMLAKGAAAATGAGLKGLGAMGASIMAARPSDMLTTAQAMAKEGKHPQEIIAATGHYADRAGNWKTQVPDHNAVVAQHEATRLKKMTPLEIRKLNRMAPQDTTRQLGSVLRHPELAAAHPQVFAKGEVKYTTDVNIGAMRPKMDSEGNLIKFEVLINPAGVRTHAKRLGVTYEEALRSVMLHETNHGIQVLDKLPNGSSGDWINELKMDEGIYRKHLNELKEVHRQMPKTAPRAKQLENEIKATESHLRLLKATENVDGEAVYRHAIGEGDSFWAESMRNDPDVARKLPSHERPERAAMSQYGNDLPLQENMINVTGTGRHPFMLEPNVAAEVGDVTASPSLLRELNAARAARRGQKQAALQPQLSEAPEGMKGLVQRLRSENRGDARIEGQIKRYVDLHANGLISEGELHRALNRMTQESKKFYTGLGAL